MRLIKQIWYIIKALSAALNNQRRFNRAWKLYLKDANKIDKGE